MGNREKKGKGLQDRSIHCAQHTAWTLAITEEILITVVSIIAMLISFSEKALTWDQRQPQAQVPTWLSLSVLSQPPETACLAGSGRSGPFVLQGSGG